MNFKVERNTKDLPRPDESSGSRVMYDDIEYCVCSDERKAVVVCAALNDCPPAIMHARGAWLEARTCADCGARIDFLSEGETCCDK